DLFAAAHDQLFDAADQREVALGVEDPLVAGAEPAAGERSGIGLRVVLVPRHHVPAADNDLASTARGEEIALLVHDADLDVAPRPDAAGLAPARRQGIGRHL